MDGTTSLKDWALSLYRKHGRLTPEIVREAARPDESPAHGFVFNVPPGEAAEAFYLDRAHRLIQTVRVTMQASPEAPPRRVRFFHAIPDEEDNYRYESVENLIRHPDMFAAARTEAVRRLRQAEDSVADLDALGSGQPPKEVAAVKRSLRAVRQARSALTPV